MDAGLLGKIFGLEQRWHGPCTVIMDAEAGMQALGLDSILGGGAKQYAPRMVSGRIACDAACLLPDGTALLLLQYQKVRTPSGEETARQILTVADSKHVVAIELCDISALTALGLTPPVNIRPISGSNSGVQIRPA
jgi:hypothetical protein